MIQRSPRIAIDGFGVSRGRLPGARQAGCAGSVQDCMPRDEGARPVPGITGPLIAPSLGVAEKLLPWRSTMQIYEVSGSPSTYSRSALAADAVRTVVPSSSVLPACGISGLAR